MSCNVYSLRDRMYTRKVFGKTREGSHPFPHWAYVVKPPALSDVGIQRFIVLSTISQHSSQ